ncbi:hypothetical protein HS088_TW07G00331 [Tripterygium wilfordii]|uniref:Replication factor A C-terminal domain-containing protein n=1 Tax=Tripterygium wilfordii TaxID=458696 RepID=A0A7J7DEK5_TRIWF|nr:uncharacterized protein LOC120002071 [Tripterygium wilfordii]KAF5744752.1 hypothetical protein HS088_TW07G00331 [Tripterygium wilfordii]
MEGEKPTTVMCSLIAMDHSDLFYRICSICEKTLPCDPSSLCKSCDCPPKRLFRLLVSIATDTKVLNVICFDRAARVLFGCSADDFFDFAKLHPFAAATAGKILEGEMFGITLSKPKNGNARHLRVASIVPLRSDFQPAIKSLRELYGG